MGWEDLKFVAILWKIMIKIYYMKINCNTYQEQKINVNKGGKMRETTL